MYLAKGCKLPARGYRLLTIHLPLSHVKTPVFVGRFLQYGHPVTCTNNLAKEQVYL